MKAKNTFYHKKKTPILIILIFVSSLTGVCQRRSHLGVIRNVPSINSSNENPKLKSNEHIVIEQKASYKNVDVFVSEDISLKKTNSRQFKLVDSISTEITNNAQEFQEPIIPFENDEYVNKKYNSRPTSILKSANNTEPHILTINDVEISKDTLLNYTGSFNNIIIPATIGGRAITIIGEEAFREKQLTKVQFANGLKEIGKMAFYYNYLTDVVIPEGVTLIGYKSFMCNDIADISIPESVVSIKEAAFNMNAITKINDVESNGIIYSRNQDGSENKTKIVSYGGINKVIDFIPAHVSVIGERAFQDTLISNVTIPSTVDTINSYAFGWTYNLSDLTLNEGLIGIGKQAFFKSKLTELNIPASVKYISFHAFRYCNLSNVTFSENSNLFVVWNNAFADNSNLSSIKLPTNINYGFLRYTDGDKNEYSPGEKFDNFSSYIISKLGYVLKPEDVEFSNGRITKLLNNVEKEIIIPDNFNGETVTKIGNNSFYGKRIKDVILPTTIKTIEPLAFYNNSITRLIIPNSVTNIGEHAFTSNSITSLELSESILNIGAGAFGDNSIIRLNIPNSVRKIGENAFNMNAIEDLQLPDSIEIIEKFTFSNNKLQNVMIPSSVSTINPSAFYNNLIETIVFDEPSNISYIGENAFLKNENLASIVLPKHASSGFTGYRDSQGNSYNPNESIFNFELAYFASIQYILTDNDVEVENGKITKYNAQAKYNYISIPDKLDGQDIVSIGSFVFRGRGLIGVNLPSKLEQIERGAFMENELISINLNNCKKLKSIENGLYEKFGLSLMSPYFKTGAFSNNNLLKIDISECNELEYIGDYTFLENKLSSIDLSRINKISYVGKEAFFENDMFSFKLPNSQNERFIGWRQGNTIYNANEEITDLEKSYKIYAPYILTDEDVVMNDSYLDSCMYNFEIKEIVIPNTLDGQDVKHIRWHHGRDGETGIFVGKGIVSVKLPSPLETIGAQAFMNNTIEYLNLDDCSNLHTICEGAFENNKLSYVDFSTCTNLINIANNAFANNILTNVLLDSCCNLTFIGSYAFSPYSSADKKINLSLCKRLVAIGNSAFGGIQHCILPKLNLTNREFIKWSNGNKDFSNGQTVSYGDITPGLTALFAPNYTPIPEELIVEDGVIVGHKIDIMSHPDIILPEKHNGQKIIGIDNYLFENSGLVSLSLPSTLETINPCAFEQCLTSIDFSNCVNLKYIGNSAFVGNSLRNIDLSFCTKLDSIGNQAFGFTFLTESVNMTNCKQLKKIEGFAFCSNKIKKLRLEGCKNLECISKFSFCNNDIDTLNIPSSLVSIQTGAFYDNGRRPNISFEGNSNIEKIEEFAFGYTNSYGNTVMNKDITFPTHANNSFVKYVDGDGKEYMPGDEIKKANTSYEAIFSTGTALKKNVLIENVRIFPNPAKTLVNVETGNLATNAIIYELYNSSGKVIKEGEIISNHYVLNIEDCNSGLYFLKLVLDNKTVRFKIIKL